MSSSDGTVPDVPASAPELIGHATVLHQKFVVRAAALHDAEGVRDVADLAARVPELEAEIERLRGRIRRIAEEAFAFRGRPFRYEDVDADPDMVWRELQEARREIEEVAHGKRS